VRLALCQTNSGDDVVANERQVTDLLERAAEGGADLAALPEVWPRQGSARQIRESAEPVPGPRTERLGEIAARHRMWVHGGSVLERDGERVFNTSVLLDREGTLVATYRKIHLFDADPPGAVPSRESSVFSAGDQVVTSETEFGRLGMSICYDVRFPELYRALAVDHWEPLLRARAIEDQAFVVAAAQWGTWGPPGRERRNYGHSLVADPWGTVIAEAPDGVGVTFAEPDLAQVEHVRQMLPSLRHRRLQPSC
jgi:predicted amidohydrolase